MVLWGLAGGAAAQSSASYRYWDALPDSLQAVMTRQHTDTARLRTLMHLTDLVRNNEAELTELVALTARLHRPEYWGYRALRAAVQLAQAKAPARPRPAPAAGPAEWPGARFR
ncbi:hypothetical protein SAMN00120144_3695 [Hymenobacter roseosalivarius DSM 11622]|uniref:Uncharacterized protein n=1 Tax=Hymenobacter roseosalivarius DSM 11622 TaxID=645990 RepID=A0A1W1W1X5_9BACT|nr:hypothetical protein SAMN00120144_3695 [Hymenobacter roseosalivarius DSM 11622]